MKGYIKFVEKRYYPTNHSKSFQPIEACRKQTNHLFTSIGRVKFDKKWKIFLIPSRPFKEIKKSFSENAERVISTCTVAKFRKITITAFQLIWLSQSCEKHWILYHITAFGDNKTSWSTVCIVKCSGNFVYWFNIDIITVELGWDKEK